MPNVLVFATAHDGALTKTGREILNAGQQLAAALQAQTEAVIIGSGVSAAATELAQAGAVKVYCADDAALASFVPELYLSCLELALKQSDAQAVLFCADSFGRDLAPKLAFRSNYSLLTEVTGFNAVNGEIVWDRPCYGGNAMSAVVAAQERQIVTVRAHSYDAELSPGSAGELVKLPLSLDAASAATRVLEVVKEASKGLSVEDASVVISGGRGMGSAEAFASLQELADVLGGAVGASRAATDAGWATTAQQVGQTGKIIAPDLYIAIGISGASQHLAGISNAKNVVAINKDEEAAIFQRANLGIVADYKTVLPELIAQCKALLS